MVTRPRNLSQADPYFDSVVLLCPFSGEDADTSASDLSNSAHTLTFNGTSALDGDIRKFGFTSLLLDGDSDFVTAPHSADWAFGSGDFTVECWVNFNALPSTETSGMCMLAHYRNIGNDRSWFFNFETNNELKFWWSTNGSTLESLESTTTPTLSTNTWYHVAACRDGGTLRIFFNGTNIGESTAITGDTLFDSTQVLDIGKLQSEGFPLRYMNGWIENVRITKGVARYTTAFTPPERAYPTRSFDTDPAFSSVELLLDMNGSTGGTTFTDLSNNGYTMSASGVTTENTQLKFGATSADITGSIGNSITTTSSPLNESMSWTIETWIYIVDLDGGYGGASRPDPFHPIAYQYKGAGNSDQGIYVSSAGALAFYRGSGHTDAASTFTWNTTTENSGNPTVPEAKWTHVAVSYDVTGSGTMYAFINGTLCVTKTPVSDGGWFDSTTAFRIGDWYHPSYSAFRSTANAYYDDYRITSVCRYTDNFIPINVPNPLS